MIGECYFDDDSDDDTIHRRPNNYGGKIGTPIQIKIDKYVPGIYLLEGTTQIPYTLENRHIFSMLNIPYKCVVDKLCLIADIWLTDAKDDSDEKVDSLVKLYELYDCTKIKIVYETYN